MSVKKSAKKSAKKAAKKAAKKTAHHHASRDLRRAYEHLGRIEILERGLARPASREIAAIGALARQRLATGENSDAAELLRAAEHFSFAALGVRTAGSADGTGRVSAELKAAIAGEFEHLTTRAAERWAGEHTRHDAVAACASALEQARNAFGSGAYRAALELARAAEALAHIAGQDAERIDSGRAAAGFLNPVR
jgi:hypothetical protein